MDGVVNGGTEAADDAPAAPATALPIVDVLASIRIEEAIFTSFTLSLAWFEAYLLRSLERAGATKILLLADPVGVNSSLNEGLVRSVGVRYAVEPVSAPDGAFHPKVGVLWSGESLVVAVGSGNLTFTGMHRNLECWEVLTAGVVGAHPDRTLTRGVAEGLNGFLHYLITRLDSGGRAVATLRAASQRIETWLPRLPVEGSSLVWMDSTRESIGNQLVRQLGAGPGRRLQVLSPFHDRDGAAVHRLAQQLGDADLDVLYFGSTTTYPLGSKAVPKGVVTRRIDGNGNERPLHAKVFRIVDADATHVLSGSANATTKALWTTGNVEVSLLRRGVFDELLSSEPGIPAVEVLTFPKSELRPLTILWARVSDDYVKARIHWTGGILPEILVIGFVDSLDALVEVPWPDEGSVALHLPSTFNAFRPRALRIEATVTVGGVRAVARAWVAFDDLLDASREYRAALSAWSKLLSGEEGDGDDDDDAALLNIFGEEHIRTMEALGAGRLAKVSRSETEAPKEDEDVSIPLRLIDALAKVPLPTGGAIDGTVGDVIHDVEKAMQAAFGALTKHPPADDEDGDPDDGRGRGTAPKPSRLSRSVRQALEHFEEVFVEAANQLSRSPKEPAHVLAYCTLCMRLVLRYRLKDAENRAGFWHSTERLVRALLCPLTARRALVALLRSPESPLVGDAAEMLLLLVALLLWHEEGGRLDGEGTQQQRNVMTRDTLREALAVLDRATGSVIQPSRLPKVLDDAFPESPEVLAEVLHKARGTQSSSDAALALKEQLHAIKRGDAIPTAKDSDLLRSARHALPEFVEPWIASCPRCHRQFTSAVRQQLLMRRPAQCLYGKCSRWMVPSEGA